MQALQDAFDRVRQVIDARAKDKTMAAVPGGATGLLVRDYKGNKADVPVYRADTALLAEQRAIMRQAAEELGQWVTKSEPSHLNLNEMTERLNAGRERARKSALQEAALKEAKGRQALNAGAQTAAWLARWRSSFPRCRAGTPAIASAVRMRGTCSRLL